MSLKITAKRSDPLTMGIRARILFLLVCLAGGMGGCGAVPQSKYYQLSAPRREATSSAAGEPFPVTVLVGPIKSSHLYREDRLVYATPDEQMGTYQVHRWAEPPAEMVRELLWRSLRESNRFSSVSLLSSSSRGDFLLEGNLYDFKEVSGSTVVARLNLDLELREIKTGAIAWTHHYSRDEPVSGKGVPAVVAALDQNAQRGVSEAVAGLTDYFAVRSRK
jgi:ABC-type uncharacterized transport system auxiliary subunit